ncbi:RB-associated KRAB zinc finger protein-like [Sabethes cyaneus]|uniref:RB-associated KRAB zinc finger protein-like n=1 Tax=Sabethes cyaneus TaxID=53552 RepID=UPI00237DDA24|nr:RB-associated KRAB zinc finger protein-like [Sabethes cyaneus]
MQNCRICLEDIVTGNAESIFADGNNLADMIQELCGLEVLKDDALPQYICQTCGWNLRSAIKLKHQCIESDQKLKEYLKENTIDVVEMPHDEPQIISFEIVYGDVPEPAPKKRVNYGDQDSTKKEHLVKSPDPKKDNYNLTAVRCCGCEAVFENNDELVIHSKEFHEAQRTYNEERPFECLICYKRYISEKGLKLHRKGIYNIKQYQCAICGKRFSNTVNLTNHERSHSKHILSYIPSYLSIPNMYVICVGEDSVGKVILNIISRYCTAKILLLLAHFARANSKRRPTYAYICERTPKNVLIPVNFVIERLCIPPTEKDT